MDLDKLFEVVVHGFIGSWSAGIKAYVHVKRPMNYGVQCIVKSLDDTVQDTVQVNVYKSKKAVRIVIQGKPSNLLDLAKKAMISGEVTEEALVNHRCIYI